MATVRTCLRDLEEYTQLASLGIAVTVREADAAAGQVILAYDGPKNVRRAVEFNLGNALKAADPRVSRVEFVVGE